MATERFGGGVLVAASGRDPTEKKTRGRAFFTAYAGFTTLSSSGFLAGSLDGKLPPIIITSSSIIAPFLDLNFPVEEGRLIEETTLLVRCEPSGVDGDADDLWIPAKILNIGHAHGVEEAASLLTSGRLLHRQRKIGLGGVMILQLDASRWSQFSSAFPSQSSSVPASITSPRMDFPCFSTSVHVGQPVIIVASPFGLVSAQVLQNSMSSGLVSRIIRAPDEHSTSGTTSQEGRGLFLIDARCLPGAEGAPVFSMAGALIGIVAPTLKIQTGSEGTGKDGREHGAREGKGTESESKGAGRDWIASLSEENEKKEGVGGGDSSPYNMDEEVDWEEIQMDIVMPVGSTSIVSLFRTRSNPPPPPLLPSSSFRSRPSCTSSTKYQDNTSTKYQEYRQRLQHTADCDPEELMSWP
jgi:hypothetical protein